MMIHEKLMSGQFLLDFKNDRSNLLNSHHLNQHNLNELHPQHQQHSGLTAHYLNHHQSLPFQQQPPSPPMSAIKMDIYAAYAYQQQQQQQQQQLMNNNNIEKHNYNKTGALDLSRRCDSVETPRKTPSPGHTNSSIGTASPAASPTNSSAHQTAQQSMIPSNLLYSVQAQQQQQQNLPLPHGNLSAGLASLYPALYYSSGLIKPEPLCTSSPSSTPPPPPPPTSSSTATNVFNSINSQLPIAAASDLLQTFANAAAVAANNTTPTTSKSPKDISSMCKSPSTNAALATPTSPQMDSLHSLDAKSTRPFKAFPRDPLVIAANFAATDVLLDNPRVERYSEFRKRVLEQKRNLNGGTRTVTNPKMRRTNSRNTDCNGSVCRSSSEERPEEEGKTDSKINVTSIEDSSDCDSNAGSFTDQHGKVNSSGFVKDAAYYERRRKNNAAAKKSRDRRRIKEDELAIRAAYLERQNIELLCQVDSLKAQIAALTSKVGA